MYIVSDGISCIIRFLYSMKDGLQRIIVFIPSWNAELGKRGTL